MNKNRIFRLICLFIAFMMMIFVIGTEMISRNAYKPQERALQSMESGQHIEVKENLEYIVFESKDMSNGKGIIFYPGGSVDEESYAPLMYALAEEGYLCAIARMPFYLAVLDVNAADDILEELGTDTEWYIAGHSLGGSMAAAYAEDNGDKIKGVILLASYSTNDLKDDDLRVLSIYGSEDGILNMERYNKHTANLPEDFREVVLMGGNHSNFGYYGLQEGDGVAGMTAEVQQERTLRAIADFVK